MSPRWSFPFLFLLLVNCASTGKQLADPAPEPLPQTVQADLPVGGGSSIDSHLYVPKKSAGREGSVGVQETEPHVHPDVWERITHRFSLPECSSHEISNSWTRWYAERPDYMARVFKRAEPWIYFIAEELDRRDMPGELALLPIVESAYDPFAYSSGRAMGTWQFIASTGRSYGLKQNWWYDGRRDVWASTHAALDYLAALSARFEGDWLLALAGYNSGENRVERQVKKNLKNGKPGDFWSLSLPSETRGYVPKLLGLACLFRDPEKFNFELPGTENAPVITAMDLQMQTDLVLISQYSGVSIDVIFSLNPGYNRWATSPDGPYQVVLPLEGAEKLQQALTQIDPRSLMKWDQVTVKSGDTLSNLAQVHNVPLSVITSANGLKSDLLSVGQKLRLPRDEQLLVDPLYASAASELQRLQAGLIASDRVNYKVRPGDSLSVIAQRYSVSVDNLKSWNKISNPRNLRAGQDLVIFQSPAPVQSRAGTVEHTVQSGDSLWSIARKYKVKLNDLMRWNGLQQKAVIQPGQSIKILF